MSAQAPAAEYTIASIKALTGPLAFVGVPEANAVKMAVDELNASNYLGAGNSIKLIANDDQNDRAQLTTLLTRAAKVDNALIALGGANSVLMIAVAPLLNDLQMPMFSTAQTGHARWIGGFILARATPRITVRDVVQAYGALRSPEARRELLAVMESLIAVGWSREKLLEGEVERLAILHIDTQYQDAFERERKPLRLRRGNEKYPLS